MAGMFGWFRFDKPGRGISKDAPKKKSIFLFLELVLRKFGLLLQLNLLYVVCCVPLITIGPATAGLTYVLRCFGREEPCFLYSDFLEKMKENFKQTLWMSIVDLFIWVLLLFDFLFFNSMAEFRFMRWFIFALALLFAMMHFFLYSIVIGYHQKTLEIYKNAFILAVARLPQNLLVLAIICLLVWGILQLHFELAITAFLVLGFSLIGFIMTFYGQSVMKKYFP